MDAGPLVTGALVGSSLTLGIAGPAAAAGGAAVGAAVESSKSFGGAGGGAIRIDIEQAPAIIAEIDKAIDHVREITRMAYAASQMKPPGDDEFSRHAIRGIGEAEDRHKTANHAYQQVLTATRDKLKQSFDAYRQGDTSAAQQVNQSGME